MMFAIILFRLTISPRLNLGIGVLSIAAGTWNAKSRSLFSFDYTPQSAARAYFDLDILFIHVLNSEPY